MRRLKLKTQLSPGDVLMLTTAIRDLHLAYPGQFETDVRTSVDAIWENNPYITRLPDSTPGVETIEMHYPSVHQSNQRPYHFIHGYAQYLEERLGVRIPLTRFHGDIHLSPEEKSSPPIDGIDIPDLFWIIVAGGKYDFTAKWWNPDYFQQVVDHFQGQIQFVQCGEKGHWHPPLKNAINLVGKTNTRQFIRLMHYAAGVICPVTFAMHLAAAVETRSGRPKHRPCVVIAGGREPTSWEAYPNHRYLSTAGMYSCNPDGGCWKSRCQLVGDGDVKDRKDLCEQPVQITPELRIARCMHDIKPSDVIRWIEAYLEASEPILQKPAAASVASGVVSLLPLNSQRTTATRTTRDVRPPLRLLIRFLHGLGDAVQLSIVLQHLKHHHPDWQIDVEALVGKHSVAKGLCRQAHVHGRNALNQADYDRIMSLEWHECHQDHANWPSTKATKCLLDLFQIQPTLELCRYQIHREPAADEKARNYLQSICPDAPQDNGRYPTVLLHYEGNTSCDRKNLSHQTARRICHAVIERGYVPVILDWDNRSPWPDQSQIFNPGADHPIWEGHGTGDAALLAALIEASSLMIGIDSGPLHVAAAATTPTLGVWTRHHPVHYFDLSDATHLVPRQHRSMAHGPASADFFERHYDHVTYENLETTLIEQIDQRLSHNRPSSLLTTFSRSNHHELDFQTSTQLPWFDGAGTAGEPAAAVSAPLPLTAVQYNRQYYEEHKQAGLDYLGYGDWQRQYGRWLIDALNLKGQRVLDVGCACGSILRGLGEAGAIGQGFDICDDMIRMGRRKWPDMAPLLHVADAAELALFPNESWDALHSSQVAEHWSPDQVPQILRQLARITVPGGLFFCSFDTEELFARQGRNMEHEDPTHICIKPMTWWHQQLTNNGWEIVTNEWEAALRQHPQSFLSRYDWDWLVARKKG